MWKYDLVNFPIGVKETTSENSKKIHIPKSSSNDGDEKQKHKIARSISNDDLWGLFNLIKHLS